MKGFIILLCLIALASSGCGVKTETPEQAVIKALNAEKNLDKETAQKYFISNDQLDNAASVSGNEVDPKIIMGKLNFKVLSSSNEKNTATVKTEITNTDIGLILKEYVTQAMTLAFSNAFSDNKLSDEEKQKQTNLIFADLLKKENNKMLTSTIDIKLTKNETSWKLSMDEALKDALLGGFISSEREIGKSFNANK